MADWFLEKLSQFKSARAEKGLAMGQKVLSEDRKKSITAAFKAWYENQADKTIAMGRIGKEQQDAFAYTSGRRTPPANALAALYQETSDVVFLCSREEKEQMARLLGKRLDPLPPSSEWPDQDDVIEDRELENIMRHIRHQLTELSRELKKLASLPENSRARERARARLAGPAMQVFEQALCLNLQFPSEFSDLLNQLSFARNLKHG